MLPWLKHGWKDPKQRRKLHKHVLEASREIGILLMAFAPLDLAVKDRHAIDWWTLLVFFLGGLVMFALGVIGEWRFKDDG